MNCSIKIIVYFHSVCVSAKFYLKFFPGAQPHDASFFKNAKQASFGNIFISLSIFLITDCEKPPTFRMSYTSFTTKCLKSSFRWSSICLQVPSNSVFFSFCLHSKFIPFRSQLAFIFEIKCYICRALPRIFFFAKCIRQADGTVTLSSCFGLIVIFFTSKSVNIKRKWWTYGNNL